MGLSRNPVGFRASWLPCSNRSVAEPKNRDVNERNAILSGSNLHLTYSYFKKIGLELTNREKTISKMTKIRSRNLVYLCWCLVWLGKWFLFQTFEELDLSLIHILLSCVEKLILGSHYTTQSATYLLDLRLTKTT